MKFLYCFIYLLSIGIVGFIIGRVLSVCKFHPDTFPYKLYRFEKDGTVYDKIKIHKWQNKVIDMSRIFTKLMPTKKLDKKVHSKLPVLIQETCIAEMTHHMLSIAGLYCLSIWKGIGGIIVTLIYITLGNLPYILIQRYNRPRFIKLLERYEARERLLKSRNSAEIIYTKMKESEKDFYDGNKQTFSSGC